MPFMTWMLNNSKLAVGGCFLLAHLRRLAPLIMAVVTMLSFGRVGAAQEDGHHDGELSHHRGLHFSHPLISESPSPDTKVRLDYLYVDLGDGAGGTVRVEGEYAFDRVFSIEIDVPYSWLDPDQTASVSNVGTVDVGLKFANFAFEELGLLLGYGIEFGLPTGDDAKGIGSDHIFEVGPFFNLGYKRRRLELVGFVEFGIPTNQDAGEEIETDLGANLSALYHFSRRLQGLIELDGESVLSGDENGDDVLNVSPGIKLRPLAHQDLMVGLSVGFPVSDLEEFDARVLVSVFYHF